ncbi:V4R domain-containing protein [Conexivisphaera calida]|nr:V4R domain-containing protein [Conexivisphaera calida]
MAGKADPGAPASVFRLPLSWFDPGRDLVSVRVRADSAGKIGMYWYYLLQNGVAIFGTMMNVAPGGALAFAILDATGMGREELMRIMRSAPVGDVEVEVIDAGVKGFASTGGHLLEAGSGRSIVMSASGLAGLFRGMRELMGDDAGAAFLYYAGFVTGREWGKFLVDHVGDPHAAARVFVEVLKSQGLATSAEILEGEDRYRIEARDLIECEVLSDYASRKGGRMRTSHWFRGIVAGVISAVRGGEWDVEEVECVNDGSDKCAFEIRRKQGTADAPAR